MLKILKTKSLVKWQKPNFYTERYKSGFNIISIGKVVYVCAAVAFALMTELCHIFVP